MTPDEDGRWRRNIHTGDLVKIVRKKDQGSGMCTGGRVQEILTNSAYHPHGIKVRLADGSVGRVQEIVDEKQGDVPSHG